MTCDPWSVTCDPWPVTCDLRIRPAVYAKLPIQCLTYLRGPCEERLLRIGKVSVTASDVRNCREKKLILSRKAAENIYQHLPGLLWVYKTRNVLNAKMLRYLREVQHISGKFLADMAKNHPYILCCDWNFSLRVNPRRMTQTNMASNWPVCMFRVRRHEVTPGLAVLWLGRKKTKVFWHQSEARTTPTIWNWSFKTMCAYHLNGISWGIF